MSEPDARGCHLTGVNLWAAGPGHPTPENLIPIRNRVTGEYVRPSLLNLSQPPAYNRGVKTTIDLSKAEHYMAEDIPAVLAHLGPGWAAAR